MFRGHGARAGARVGSRRGSLPVRPVGVRFGTWNVHGCRRAVERRSVDAALSAAGVDLACVQETHLATGRARTASYRWFLSGGRAPAYLRGTGILVRRDAGAEVLRFEAVSDSLCVLHLRFASGVADYTEFVVISVHARSAAHYSHCVFNTLGCLLAGLPHGQNVVVAGDMNAHLGANDLAEEDGPFIGKNLHHDADNINAVMLKELVRTFGLVVWNTREPCNATRVTHVRPTSQAQPSHILSNWGYVRGVAAKWGREHVSEHKILLCTLRLWPLVSPRQSRLAWAADAMAAVLSAIDSMGRAAGRAGRALSSPASSSPRSPRSPRCSPNPSLVGSTSPKRADSGPGQDGAKDQPGTHAGLVPPCTLVKVRVFDSQVTAPARPLRKQSAPAVCGLDPTGTYLDTPHEHSTTPTPNSSPSPAPSPSHSPPPIAVDSTPSSGPTIPSTPSPLSAECTSPTNDGEKVPPARRPSAIKRRLAGLFGRFRRRGGHQPRDLGRAAHHDEEWCACPQGGTPILRRQHVHADGLTCVEMYRRGYAFTEALSAAVCPDVVAPALESDLAPCIATPLNRGPHRPHLHPDPLTPRIRRPSPVRPPLQLGASVFQQQTAQPVAQAAQPTRGSSSACSTPAVPVRRGRLYLDESNPQASWRPGRLYLEHSDGSSSASRCASPVESNFVVHSPARARYGRDSESLPYGTPCASPLSPYPAGCPAHSTPHGTPRRSTHGPHSTPHGTPHGTPRGTPHATPHTTPHITPHVTPHATPHSTPHATPRSTPVATPDGGLRRRGLSAEGERRRRMFQRLMSEESSLSHMSDSSCPDDAEDLQRRQHQHQQQRHLYHRLQSEDDGVVVDAVSRSRLTCKACALHHHRPFKEQDANGGRAPSPWHSPAVGHRENNVGSLGSHPAYR